MLIEKIGKPAMLEQTAEECVELAHACLKLARHYRAENKVYGKSEEEMLDNLAEEMADVKICTFEILSGFEMCKQYDDWFIKKESRLLKRLEELDDEKGSATYEFVEMAVKMMEQEPCEDAISRQAVLDLVVTNHTELNGVNVVMYSPFCKDIKQLSPVTPKAKSDVLDKIREEIEEMYYIDEGLSFDPQISREDVLKIIDKYKAESEG